MKVIYKSENGRDYATQKDAMKADCEFWEREWVSNTAVCRNYKRKILPSAFALWQNRKHRAREDWQRIYPAKHGHELNMYIREKLLDVEREYYRALDNYKKHCALGKTAKVELKNARSAYAAYMMLIDDEIKGANEC